MTTEIDRALRRIDYAASELFEADPAVYSVGVGYQRGRLGYIASRDRTCQAGGGDGLPKGVNDFPVLIKENDGRPGLLATTTGLGLTGASWPEQQWHRPVVCGLEIQNFDHADQTGALANRRLLQGSLGCLVRLADQRVALLSNRHVLASTTRARIGDEIYQPASATRNSSRRIATLHDMAPLHPSPTWASHKRRTAHLNYVDAAVAVLDRQVPYQQAYLRTNNLPSPHATDVPALGDSVYKVGRATGVTHGYVTQIGVVVAVPYGHDMYWFQDAIIVERGLDDEELDEQGEPFAEGGDSGAAVVRQDGVALGLLFAGSGADTYACPIQAALGALNCKLV